MHGLKVETWEQWESLNCYMMSQLVEKNAGEHVRYQSYGGRGQAQFGIDLVPCNSPIPVVGQSKMREMSAFTWQHVEAELKKTDGYSNPIAHYFIFTTAAKHTSIQDVQNRGAYQYTRPNGSSFYVYVKYWDDYQDLSFVPIQVLKDLFPAVNRQFAGASPGPSFSPEFVSSLAALRSYIPTIFPMELLHWLENWDYSRGYVPSAEYDRLQELYFEFSRVESAHQYGNQNLLLEGDRLRISSCLPAGQRLFQALADFRNEVNTHTVGGNLQDGGSVLWLQGIPSIGWPSITSGWRSAALGLANIYRTDVLGQPQG